MKQTLSAFVVLLLSSVVTVPAWAQKSRASRVSTPAVSESAPSSSYTYSGSSGKFIEIASNQVLFGGLVGGGMNSTLYIPTSGTVLFGLSAEGNFNLSGPWQISVPLYLLASSSTSFLLGAGPQYNFGEGSRMNQFWVNFRPGLYIQGGDASFLLNATVGKRFEILPGLAYRPNFGIMFDTNAGEAGFSLSPFALSFEI